MSWEMLSSSLAFLSIFGNNNDLLLLLLLGFSITVVEIYSLKKRRYHVYQMLVREARARRSEMDLHAD